MSPTTIRPVDLTDLRRDAITLVCEEQAREIEDLRFQDPITESDVNLLMDSSNDDRWEGIFQHDHNGERIYQISYRFKEQQFYISIYDLTACVKADAPYLS